MHSVVSVRAQRKQSSDFGWIGQRTHFGLAPQTHEASRFVTFRETAIFSTSAAVRVKARFRGGRTSGEVLTALVDSDAECPGFSGQQQWRLGQLNNQVTLEPLP
jgi:hypothetical protein